MWLQTLPRAERLPAIQAYLAGSQGRTDDQDRLKEYADYLQKTRNDAPHSCKIVNEVDHADLKLSYVHYQLLTLGESELGPVIGNENRRIEIDMSVRSGRWRFVVGHFPFAFSPSIYKPAILLAVSGLIERSRSNSETTNGCPAE